MTLNSVEGEKFKDKLIGGDVGNMALSWAIGAPENSERCHCKFEETLTNGHYYFEKIQGANADNGECYYFIPNIAVTDAQYLFKAYKQRAFVFGQKDYDFQIDKCYLQIEVWRSGRRDNMFELADSQSGIEDTADSVNNFFTRHGFKLRVPFSILEMSQRFFERINWKSPSQLNSEAYVYITKSEKYVGSARWHYRGRMFHKPLVWEGADGTRNCYYHIWKDN